MADRPAFSASSRRGQSKFNALARDGGSAAAGRSKAKAGFGAKVFAAKDNVHLWDTAFHAERGCLSAANMPGHPAMRH